MDKNLKYYNFLKSNKANKQAEEYKEFYNTEKEKKKTEGTFNGIDHIKLTFCQLLLNDAIKQRETDLKELPLKYEAAAGADSYEALLYWRCLIAGYTYRDIAEIVNRYSEEANPCYKCLLIKKTSYKGRIGEDLTRKKLATAINNNANKNGKGAADPEQITDFKLKQIPFIKALIDLHTTTEEEKKKLAQELEALLYFIENIQDGTTKELFKSRYIRRKQWEDVAAECLGYSINGDNSGEKARKIVERYLKKHNGSSQLF